MHFLFCLDLNQYTKGRTPYYILYMGKEITLVSVINKNL